MSLLAGSFRSFLFASGLVVVALLGPVSGARRAGSKVNVRAKVTSGGDQPATKVVVCAAKFCRMLGTIAPGQAKKIQLEPRLGKKAKGSAALKVSARGRGIEPASARVRIKVK